MKRTIAFLLSAVMLLSLFTFVSCDEQTINDAADLALELIEAIPDAEDTQDTASETSEDTRVTQQTEPEPESAPETDAPTIDEFGSYDDKENVALYIHTYGKLPPNYISKSEAEDLGWECGSVEKYAEGKCIGGSKFGNYEGLLPKKDGRQYYECDIDTLGEDSRGAKRIVYSNDGLIYYTDDHYETFELLYGEE